MSFKKKPKFLTNQTPLYTPHQTQWYQFLVILWFPFQMVVLMDPMDDQYDILRVNRSREKQYMFDFAFDGTTVQVCLIVLMRGQGWWCRRWAGVVPGYTEWCHGDSIAGRWDLSSSFSFSLMAQDSPPLTYMEYYLI